MVQHRQRPQEPLDPLDALLGKDPADLSLQEALLRRDPVGPGGVPSEAYDEDPANARLLEQEPEPDGHDILPDHVEGRAR